MVPEQIVMEDETLKIGCRCCTEPLSLQGVTEATISCDFYRALSNLVKEDVVFCTRSDRLEAAQTVIVY